MITIILLIWIGIQLNAPVWYNIACAVLATIKVSRFCYGLYKKGKEQGQKD